MRSKALLKRIAAWTLLVLVATFVDGAFRHTDDGCVVELHCLACRTAHVPATIGIVASPVASALHPTEAVAPSADALPRIVFVPRTDTRGPPTLA